MRYLKLAQKKEKKRETRSHLSYTDTSLKLIRSVFNPNATRKQLKINCGRYVSEKDWCEFSLKSY